MSICDVAEARAGTLRVKAVGSLVVSVPHNRNGRSKHFSKAKYAIVNLFGMTPSESSLHSMRILNGGSRVSLEEGNIGFVLFFRDSSAGRNYEDRADDWQRSHNTRVNIEKKAIDYENGIAGFIYRTGAKNG